MEINGKEISLSHDELLHKYFIDGLAIAVWIMIVSVTVYLSLFPRFRSDAVLTTMLSTALLLLVWNLKTRRVIFSGTNREKIYQLGSVFSTFLVVTAAAVFVSPCIVEQIETKLLKNYEKDLLLYKNDPDGFVSLKKMAKNDFHIDVVLADAEDAFPGVEKHSPASMDYGWQYCILRMGERSVKFKFPAPKPELQKVWLKAVEMHEFSHCIDVSRDLGDYSKPMKSISPYNQASVHDLDTFLDAEKSNNSKRWREIGADVMTVGFMKLSHPELAGEIANALARKRDADQIGAKPDVIHDTSCFIRIAMNTAPPANTKTLLIWADAIRNSTNCK